MDYKYIAVKVTNKGLRLESQPFFAPDDLTALVNAYTPLRVEDKFASMSPGTIFVYKWLPDGEKGDLVSWHKQRSPIAQITGRRNDKIAFVQYMLLEKRQNETSPWIETSKGVRKSHECLICRRVIQKGELAYRPMGNKAYRASRICVECVASYDQCDHKTAVVLVSFDDGSYLSKCEWGCNGHLLSTPQPDDTDKTTAVDARECKDCGGWWLYTSDHYIHKGDGEDCIPF